MGPQGEPGDSLIGYNWAVQPSGRRFPDDDVYRTIVEVDLDVPENGFAKVAATWMSGLESAASDRFMRCYVVQPPVDAEGPVRATGLAPGAGSSLAITHQALNRFFAVKPGRVTFALRCANVNGAFGWVSGAEISAQFFTNRYQ